jgi:hypothetical protein
MLENARKGRKLALPGAREEPADFRCRAPANGGAGGGRLRMACLVQSCRGFSFCLRRGGRARGPLLFPLPSCRTRKKKKDKRAAKWPPRPTDVDGLWPREAKPTDVAGARLTWSPPASSNVTCDVLFSGTSLFPGGLFRATPALVSPSHSLTRTHL